jgi:LPS O-antigen subunit length determinant protein (WzzB/FepE family)
MERSTRVSVFESDKPAEIQLIKSKLDDANIKNAVENNYLTFTTTPTATSLKVMVKLEDEKKAFEVIDAYLQQNENQ